MHEYPFWLYGNPVSIVSRKGAVTEPEWAETDTLSNYIEAKHDEPVGH